MQILPLQHEQTGLGPTHKIIVTHEDLTETTANTAQVIPLLTVALGDLVEVVATYVPTAFQDASDAAFNTTAITIGDGGSANRLLTSQELNVNGSEVLGKAGVAGGYVYLAGDTVDLTVGSMSSKSLSNIDTGELHIFVRKVSLTEL